jgi:hypothetical protein
MYTVVILAEQAMSDADAAEVVSLHESIEDSRRYVVLIPCEDAAQRVEAALSSLAASDVLASPPDLGSDVDLSETQNALDAEADDAVTASVRAIRAHGVAADGRFSRQDPVDELVRIVASQHGDEVIVMTRPHVIADFLHLDWASKARRRLGVPLVHLMEHEPLDAEAANGQGITGM